MRNRKDILNKEEIEKIARAFLEAVDPDPDRDGLKETPKRVAKYWIELLEGQKYTNDEIAEMYNKCFDLDEGDTNIGDQIKTKDLVVEKDIPIFSHCEHH